MKEKVDFNTQFSDKQIEEAVKSELQGSGIGSLDITNIMIQKEEKIDKNDLEDFFQIKELIQKAQEGSVVPIAFCDGSHWVAFSIVPDNTKGTNGVSVIYANSMVGSEVGLYGVGKEVAKMIAEIAQAGDYIDCSSSQQYGQCCGSSTAINLVTIAKHFNGGLGINELKNSIWNPKNNKEKVEKYSKIFDYMNGADNSKSSSEVKSEPREKILNYKIGQNLGFKPYSDSQTTSDLQIIFEFIYAAILFLMKGEFITAILGQKNKKEKLTYNQSSIDVT